MSTPYDTGYYHEFYDLIACALETHNPRLALQRVAEAREYLSEDTADALVRELECDYWEFT